MNRPSENINTNRCWLTVPGDLNGDGVNDVAAYVTFRDGLGEMFDQGDHDDWKANFGDGDGGASSANPEPSTAILLVMGAVLVVGLSKRR